MIIIKNIEIKLNLEKSTYNIDINGQDLKNIAYLLMGYANSIPNQEHDIVKECRAYEDAIDQILRFSSKYSVTNVLKEGK